MPSDDPEKGLAVAVAEARQRWLEELIGSRTDVTVAGRDDADEPLLIQGADTLLPPHLLPYYGQSEQDALFLYIEVESPLGLESLGNMLTALERGIKLSVKRSDRAQLRVVLAKFGTGSIWLEVVVPVLGLAFSAGSFLTAVYATFAAQTTKQRTFAQATTTLLLEDGASAVTVYAEQGRTVLRVDRGNASAYRTRRSEQVRHAEPEAPVQALPALQRPTTEGPVAGSGIVRRVNGLNYVELAGREGALVRIFDHRRTEEPLVLGGRYNFDGRFEVDASGFPEGYLITSALLLERAPGPR